MLTDGYGIDVLEMNDYGMLVGLEMLEQAEMFTEVFLKQCSSAPPQILNDMFCVIVYLLTTKPVLM